MLKNLGNTAEGMLIP